jgi:chemotaxis protein CheD
MVRMGELVVSGTEGDELVALGLGSCIGLALHDPVKRIVGLAHIVLPSAGSTRGDGGPARFADHAVPRLIADMKRLGAAPHRLEAILAGGAKMFQLGDNLDIGRRNAEATIAALEAESIPVRATATGGGAGRTMRISVGGGRVTVKDAGGKPVVLHEGRP